MYHIKRSIFFREQSSKMYSPMSFAISMLVAELPYAILCAILFFLPLYYLPGFQTEPSRAGYQFFMVLITELFSVTLGQGLASLTPSTFISSQFDPFIMVGCDYSSASLDLNLILKWAPDYVRTFLRCSNPFRSDARLLAQLAVPARSFHASDRRHGRHGTPPTACHMQAMGAE
jgi:hypothetical protein